MKQTVYRGDFIQRFMSQRPDNFSRLGLNKLFDYFEEYERDTGEEMELDVISICCEYAEDTIENVLKEHDLEDIEELSEHTHVIAVDEEMYLKKEVK